MASFEPNMSNSEDFQSSETDRSRSAHGNHGVTAMQVHAQNIPTPSSESESRSMSTPEQRVVLAKAGRETLSNFLRDGSQASSPTIPQNPFPNPGSSAGGQGPTYSQTNVRNELHVSMNPFVIARAHQVIEQARERLRAEAIQHVEAERGIAIGTKV